MNSKCIYLLTVACLLLTGNLSSQEKLLVSGCGWKNLAVIDKASKSIEWSHALNPGEDCNDVEITKEGAVLYAYTKGARMISFDQQVLWDYKALPGEELFTATQLPSGKYLLAICGTPSRLVILDKQGKADSEIPFKTDIMKVHDQFRQVVLSSKNTYLIPLMGEGKLVEVDDSGNLIRSIDVGGNPFSVKYIHPESVMVSCGDAHKFVEVNLTEGKITKEVTTNMVDGASLLFVAELIRYPNGNTLIANWNGHSKDKTQPKMVEIDENNRIVWSLEPVEGVGNISTIYSFTPSASHPFRNR